MRVEKTAESVNSLLHPEPFSHPASCSGQSPGRRNSLQSPASSFQTAARISTLFSRQSGEENISLRTLSLRNYDLSSVPAETLVAVISGLEQAGLSRTNLTSQQLTEIYRMVAERRSSRLRWIDLRGNNPSDVSQDLRARAKLNQSLLILD